MLKEDWEVLARRFGYADEKAMFLDLYAAQHISIPELGRRLGFTQGTIARRITLLGIEKRSRGGANNEFSQQIRLWRFDQRLLHCFSRGQISNALGVSTATLQNYISSCVSTTWPTRREV